MQSALKFLHRQSRVSTNTPVAEKPISSVPYFRIFAPHIFLQMLHNSCTEMIIHTICPCRTNSWGTIPSIVSIVSRKSSSNLQLKNTQNVGSSSSLPTLRHNLMHICYFLMQFFKIINHTKNYIQSYFLAPEFQMTSSQF